MKNNQIRLIAGRYKGKKLIVHDAPGLRPTPNRVRETLFNWLQFEIAGMHTLDLFAGSGLLSFEALSRGAASVTLIEKEKSTFEQLKYNSSLLGPNNVKIIQADAFDYIIKQQLDTYQLLFIDPPFHTPLLEKILLCLKDKLAKDTYLYIESESEIAMTSLPYPARRLKHKKAGLVHYALFKIDPPIKTQNNRA